MMLIDDRPYERQEKRRAAFLEEDEDRVLHYYGDIVRRLFISAGVIMIVTLPFFNDRIHLHPFFSLFAITVIGFVAGLINPKQIHIIAVQTAIAIAGAIAFGQYSISAYITYSTRDAFFWVNLALTLIFFFSLYYSTKSLRGAYLAKND